MPRDKSEYYPPGDTAYSQRLTNDRIECKNWTEPSSTPSGEQVPGSRAVTVYRRRAALLSRRQSEYCIKFYYFCCGGGPCSPLCAMYVLSDCTGVVPTFGTWLFFFILTPLSLLLLLLLSRRHYDGTAHYFHLPLRQQCVVYIHYDLVNNPKSNFVCASDHRKVVSTHRYKLPINYYLLKLYTVE